MTRTIINLSAEDKRWLDRMARDRKVPMTELVREAVGQYRLRQEARNRPDLGEALKRTSGTWRHGDGLRWQRQMRDEWNDGS